MSTVTASADQPRAGFLERHHFLLRRLHSLSGIIPIGLFVCFHLFTNMQILTGSFQHEVEWIHSQPALLFMEIFVLWLPIAFHAGLGILYTVTGTNNTRAYGYGANWRYVLQRVTGILALIFIFVHVATLRWGWNIFGLYSPFFVSGSMPGGEEIPLATASIAMILQGGPNHNIALAIGINLLYIIGAFSIVYHWSNGLWTAAITWGVTLTAKAQRNWGYVCIAMGISLALFTAASLYGSWTYKISDQERETLFYLYEHGSSAEHTAQVAPAITHEQSDKHAS